MKPPVRSKRDFVDRFIKGEFGNRTANWATLEEFVDSRFTGLVHVRNRLAGRETWYNIPTEFVKSVWEVASKKYGSENLYISQMGVESDKIFQGEVQRAPWGYYLYYSVLALPMREALAKWNRHATGLVAQVLLKKFLCQRSREWLEYLFDEYPEHVVEFSSYWHEVGIVPGFNTMFWEVRLY